MDMFHNLICVFHVQPGRRSCPQTRFEPERVALYVLLSSYSNMHRTAIWERTRKITRSRWLRLPRKRTDLKRRRGFSQVGPFAKYNAFCQTTKSKTGYFVVMQRRVLRVLPQSAAQTPPTCVFKKRSLDETSSEVWAERQWRIRKNAYTRNKRKTKKLVDKERFPTFVFTDRCRSQCAFVYWYCKAVQRISGTKNTVR